LMASVRGAASQPLRDAFFIEENGSWTRYR
jgi:hypothetical protein